MLVRGHVAMRAVYGVGSFFFCELWRPAPGSPLIDYFFRLHPVLICVRILVHVSRRIFRVASQGVYERYVSRYVTG